MKKLLTRLLLIAALCVPWATQAQGDTISTFPFTCDFEDADDNAHWSFQNAANGWHIGAATNHTVGGDSALYVSDNAAGTTNNYSGSACVSYAWLTLEIDAPGQYALQFDWKCAGESTYDFLRVAVAPTSTSLTTPTYSNWTATAVPTGFTAIDGGNKLNLAGTSWNTKTGVITFSAAGVYRLLFVWRNDPSVYNQPPAAIDNVILTEVTCPQPTALSAMPSSDELAISWTAGGTETEWMVTLNDSLVDYTTTTSYTATNLEGNTLYSVKVYAICGVGDTSLATAENFRTTCAPISQLPYSNDFENDPYYSAVAYADAFPTCWTRINDASGTYNYYPYLTTTASYVHSGSKGMYWYHSTTTTYANNEYAVLPPIDLDEYDISDLTLSFFAKTTSASYHPQPIVGVMTSPTDASTFVPVRTFSATDITTDWQMFDVSFASYTGEGAFIAIKWPRTSSTCYMAIDDIYLTNVWCDMPSDLTATSTLDEVTLSWNGNGASSFEVVLGSDTIPGVTDTFYVFSDLDANTNYNYAVAAECTDGNSMYITGSIRTLCYLIDSLPYSYGFEDMATGSSSVRPEIPCWHHINNGTTYFGYPYVTSTSHNGSRSLYWYGSTTATTYGDYQIVVLPGVDTNIYPLNTLRLKFWARPSSTSYYPVFQVGVMSDPDNVSTFQNVQTVNVANVTTWQEFIVPFSNFTGSGQFIAVRLNRPTSSYYAYTDDFTLEMLPTCPDVSNVEATATVGNALLTWDYSNTIGEPDGFEVIYDSINGSNPTTVSVTEPMAALSGLEPRTTYKAYVRTMCGNSYGVSDSVQFVTGPFSTINFDGGSTTTYYLPIGNFYNYSYTQQLILASEMEGATTLTGIDFEYAYSSASTAKTNVSIYLANVTESSLSSSFVNYNASTFKLVYTGNLNCTPGWNHFEFDTAFNYDGTSNLLIFVHDNSGDYDGSSYTFYAHTESGKGRYIQNDNDPYSLTSSPGAGTSVSYRANMRLHHSDDGEVTCAAPLLHMTMNDDGDIDLTWIPGYQETSWDVDYRIAGTSTWTTLLTSTTSTSYTVLMSDLQSNSTYEFRVVANCSDTTIASTAVSFTTPCEYATLPIIENFDSYAGSTATSPVPEGFLPNCWNIYNDGTRTNYMYAPYVYNSSTYAHSGSNSIRFYSYNSSGDSNQYLILPAVNPEEHQISELQLSFWLRGNNTSASYRADVVVGVMTNILDESSFIPYDTILCNSTTYARYQVIFSQYTGNNGRVTLLFPKPLTSSSYEYGYLDDLTLEVIPDCPAVSNVSLTASDNESLTLSWTENGNATSWNVEYGPHGFTLGNGTTDIATSIPYTISNLNANTEYDVYITPVCGDDVAGTTMASFRTDCGPITVLPYIESFESYPVGSSTSATYEIPCWARLDNAGQNHFGYVNNSSSWAAGPHTGDKFLYYYLPSNAGTHADWLLTILPTIDTNVYPMNTLQLSFWVRMNSASTTSFIEVGVISDITDQTTFTPVDTVPVSGDVHTLKTAYLSNFTGSGDRIAMRFHRTTESTAHYFFVDDITIEPIPDCPAVSNISLSRMTSDSLYVTWSENGAATSWTVEYGPTGFTPGNGTTDIVTSLPYEIGGLSANTAYDIYITPDCDNGVAATRIGTFRTDCGPTPVPFTESFDTWSSTAADPLPNCWDKHTNYSTNYPYASTSYAHSGSKSMYMYSTSSTYSYMVLPSFDLPIDSTMISFWLYKSNTSYAHKLQVGVMSDPADVTTFVQVAEVVPTLSSTWEQFEVPFSSYNGTGTRIAIMSPNNEYSYPYLDDLTVSPISGCQRVIDLTASSVMLDSAIITWTDGSNTSWYVEYDVVDFTPGTTPGHNLITVTDTFCVLSGLDTGATYHVYVYPDCDTTIAERHITFTTLAAPPATVPYSCDFEATGVNGWDFIQGGQNNYWVVGNAVNNGGSRSMYVTDDGTTNSYSGNASYSFAVRTFNLQAGNYICSYDWKCNGEGSYDFIRAALVPAGANITAGDYSGFDNASAMPAGSIALDGGYRQNLQTTWQTQLTEFTLASAGTYKVVFMWRNDGSVYNVPPAAIDNVQLMMNTCPMPENIAASNLTQTGADFTWTEAGTATEWQYQVGSSTPTTVYSTTCSVTGLTANTPYLFRVRSICGPGDTSAWASYNFRTPCGYMTVPYTQDFESEPTGSSSTGSAFANCWTRLNNGTSYGGYPYVSSSSTYNHTVGGSKGLYWYNSTTAGTYGDYQCVVLPPIDPAISIDSLQLSFWAKASSASYVPVFQIGVMTDPNNISTFVGVDTITITSGTTWMNFEVPLTAYTGTGSFIAVKADRPTSSWYAYVDDFFLDYVPTCLAPHNLHATASTTSSITIDWTDLSTASQWEVEYTGNGATNTTLASAHPYTLSNLPASTAYSIRVRAICGVGDTSYWTMAENAATDCGLVTLPYTEDFENYTGTTYSTNGVLPVCWDGYSNGSTPAYFPHITGSGSYWYPHGGANALTMTSGSATYGDTKIVVLPLFNQPMNTLSMTFWYKMENASNGSTLYVGYVTSPGYDTSFVPLKTITSTTTLTRDSISFDTVPATATNIAFKWYYNTSFYSVGIDDIEVTSSGAYCNTPTLLPVSGLSYNTATVNWNSNATEFEVAVKAANDATWPEAVAVSNANSYNVNGLIPATPYQFRVRAICDATEELISDWAVGNFITDSLPCFDPSGLEATATTFTTATLDWEANGIENQWSIHVWNNTFNQEYTADAHPFTVTGLDQTLTYNAAVKAICGGGATESEYSDTIQFTTATCEQVTGVTATATNSTTATVNWTAASASSYQIDYGPRGHGQGSGTIVNVDANNYTITGLSPETAYSVYVRAVCEPGVYGLWSTAVEFTTPSEEGIDLADGIGLNIYPNPTSSTTTIALSGVNGTVSVSIVDMNGRVVMSDSMSCEGDCVKTMEVSGLAQGAYFVRISGENVNMVKKLVVK